MTRLLLGLAALFAPVMGGCSLCDEAPETYNGAPMNGSFSGPGYTCASYADRNCDYTLCQQDGCGRDWELTSWYCY